MVFINGRETIREKAVSNRTCSSPHCFAVISELKKSGFTKKEVANRSVIVATCSAVRLRPIRSCFFGLWLTNKLIFGLWFHWFKTNLRPLFRILSLILDILFTIPDIFYILELESIAGVLTNILFF